MHKYCRVDCYPGTGYKVLDILENLFIFKHVSQGRCHTGINRFFLQQNRASRSLTSAAPFWVEAKRDMKNGRSACRHRNACGPGAHFALQKSWKATEGMCHLLPKGNVGWEVLKGTGGGQGKEEVKKENEMEPKTHQLLLTHLLIAQQWQERQKGLSTPFPQHWIPSLSLLLPLPLTRAIRSLLTILHAWDFKIWFQPCCWAALS